MECLNIDKMGERDEKLGNPEEEITLDGTVDKHGRPAVRAKTGRWFAGVLLLVNQGLATLAFFGVGENLVLFLTRVMGEDNAEAANNVSKWTGTVYIFSLLGAFLSDSYWGRYKTCAIFQAIFVAGLVSLSVCSYIFLVKPNGCGDEITPCGPHDSSIHIVLFYVSIYLIALGNGGYQPTIATFGSDQFDEDHPQESHSKVSFFGYFYLALNLGSLFSNTFLVYFEDKGMWTLGFWASAGSAILALLLFLIGTPSYRHFKPTGNPISRFCQVVVAAIRKWKIEQPSNGGELYEGDGRELADNSSRNILHTKEFKFLDKAAIITSKERLDDRWRLCPVTQVEEVKCILRLFPIWLCTILYSVVFTQMASLFVEQGNAMKTTVSGFHIPPASMSSFDILSVAAFIFIYRRVLDPLVASLKKSSIRGLTELQRMGVGLIIAIMGMVAAGIVEHFRLQYANKDCSHCTNSSSLSIFWQVPQYVLIGASEVFMYVGQLEFFNGQAPDGLKSFGSALCMTSISLGNYVSSLLVSVVSKISTTDKMPGWIPGNLNKGHLDRFYFLLAALTTADFVVYLICAKWYKYIEFEQRSSGKQDEEKQGRGNYLEGRKQSSSLSRLNLLQYFLGSVDIVIDSVLLDKAGTCKFDYTLSPFVCEVIFYVRLGENIGISSLYMVWGLRCAALLNITQDKRSLIYSQEISVKPVTHMDTLFYMGRDTLLSSNQMPYYLVIPIVATLSSSPISETYFQFRLRKILLIV